MSSLIRRQGLPSSLGRIPAGFQVSFNDPACLSAFTKTFKSGNDYVEQNTAGTWCYYPAANSQLDVACVGKQGELAAVMDVHLAQGVSISYYGANNQRLGGAEYPVKTTAGKVYLCVSGKAGDGTYKTECEISELDNRFGDVGTRCALPISQKTVSDGCYAPGEAPTTVNTRPPATKAAGSGTATSLSSSTLGSGAVSHKSVAPVVGFGMTTLFFVLMLMI